MGWGGEPSNAACRCRCLCPRTTVLCVLRACMHVQLEGESDVDVMLRVLDGGPGLWRRTRAALAERARLMHERARWCVKQFVEWGTGVARGDADALAKKPSQAVAKCMQSMTLEDWQE